MGRNPYIGTEQNTMTCQCRDFLTGLCCNTIIRISHFTVFYCLEHACVWVLCSNHDQDFINNTDLHQYTVHNSLSRTVGPSSTAFITECINL